MGKRRQMSAANRTGVNNGVGSLFSSTPGAGHTAYGGGGKATKGGRNIKIPPRKTKRSKRK